MPRPPAFNQNPHLDTDEEPTRMEMLVDLVSKTAKSEAYGSVHPISVRIPTVHFTAIQAISKHSGMSMNKTIVTLLDAALDELWKQLDQSDRDAIENIRSDFIQAFVASGEYPQAAKGEI